MKLRRRHSVGGVDHRLGGADTPSSGSITGRSADEGDTERAGAMSFDPATGMY
jgi:hypothetical protein